MKISIFGDTIVGKQRDHNEDSFVILCDINKQWQEINDQQISISDSRGLIFAVADGMGGTNAGEVASAVAVNTIKEKIDTISYIIKSPEQIHKIFNSIILTIHTNILKETKKNKETKGMGTTIVLGLILKNVLYVTWIGDSRCYHYNKTTHVHLTPFSEDHSLVWSRVKSGEITPEEARLSSESNLLLQSLGDTYQHPHPDFKWIKLANNDRILLCSDGLNSMLSAIGIQQILDFSDSTKDTCQSLINASNNAGGHDNITAILVDIIETDTTSKSSVGDKPFNKRWSKGLVTFLVLTLIGIGAYFTDKKLNYIDDIKKKFLSIIQKDSTNTVNNKEPGSTTDQSDSISLYPQNIIDTTTIPDLEKEPTNNKKTKVKAGSVLNPEKVKQSLQTAMDRIKRIEIKIDSIQPNNSEYQPEFYLVHSKSLESILHSLDSLKNRIRGFAEIKDYEIVRLKEFNIEENKISSILRTIDSLNTSTENILSSQ